MKNKNRGEFPPSGRRPLSHIAQNDLRVADALRRV
jgi:hypothetical protein